MLAEMRSSVCFALLNLLLIASVDAERLIFPPASAPAPAVQSGEPFEHYSQADLKTTVSHTPEREPAASDPSYSSILHEISSLFALVSRNCCGAACAVEVENASNLASSVTSAKDPAARDCHNVQAVAANINVNFLGPEHQALVGPVTFAYRRFGPLEPVTNTPQRTLVRASHFVSPVMHFHSTK